MKHTVIKFDILLVTYNRPKLLKHTLDCLSMQTYKNFVVHLVDNGSSPPVDQNSLPDDLDIIFTRFESNQNPSDAGQAGLKNTKGTHFLWIADDDVLVTSALQIIADFFENDSAIEAISSGFSKFDHENHIPLSNKTYLSSFMRTIQKVDAFQAGLGYCNSWGIGKLAHYPLPRMSHSSAFFFSQSLIERTVRKQGELLIKPFSDVGFVGCCFNTKNLYYLDLPLVILGESKFKEMHGLLPGNT